MSSLKGGEGEGSKKIEKGNFTQNPPLPQPSLNLLLGSKPIQWIRADIETLLRGHSAYSYNNKISHINSNVLIYCNLKSPHQKNNNIFSTLIVC